MGKVVFLVLVGLAAVAALAVDKTASPHARKHALESKSHKAVKKTASKQVVDELEEDLSLHYLEETPESDKQLLCKMNVRVVLDRSGSIHAKPSVQRYSEDFYSAFIRRYDAIDETLGSHGFTKNSIAVFAYGRKPVRLAEAGIRMNPYACMNSGVTRDSCNSNTFTKDAMVLALGTDDTVKKTILLVTDGAANDGQDPEDFITTARGNGHNVYIVFIGAREADRDRIRAYTQSDEGLSGFYEVLLCDGCSPDDAESTADEVIKQLCKEGRKMFVHFETAQYKFNGGKCGEHPEQSKEVNGVLEGVTRGSCQQAGSKIYVVGRFSGTDSASNINLAVKRAKTMRNKLKADLGLPSSKFQLAWGMVGTGTTEGACDSQRVDVYCGTSDSSVDIPSHIKWTKVTTPSASA